MRRLRPRNYIGHVKRLVGARRKWRSCGCTNSCSGSPPPEIIGCGRLSPYQGAATVRRYDKRFFSFLFVELHSMASGPAPNHDPRGPIPYRVTFTYLIVARLAFSPRCGFPEARFRCKVWVRGMLLLGGSGHRRRDLMKLAGACWRNRYVSVHVALHHLGVQSDRRPESGVRHARPAAGISCAQFHSIATVAASQTKCHFSSFANCHFQLARYKYGRSPTRTHSPKRLGIPAP